MTIENNQFQDFTSEYSGVHFKLHSDRDYPFDEEIDVEALDELIHIGYTDDVEYPHPIVAAAMECFSDRIIDQQEFAGDIVNIFIASDPRTCWKNLRIQEKPKETPDGTFCDSTGGSYHKVRTGIIPFHPFYDEKWSAVFVANHDPDEARQELSEDIQHEVVGHLYPQMLGLPFKWGPNERFARYIGREIRESVYASEEIRNDGVTTTSYSYPEILNFREIFFAE